MQKSLKSKKINDLYFHKKKNWNTKSKILLFPNDITVYVENSKYISKISEFSNVAGGSIHKNQLHF